MMVCTFVEVDVDSFLEGFQWLDFEIADLSNCFEEAVGRRSMKLHSLGRSGSQELFNSMECGVWCCPLTLCGLSTVLPAELEDPLTLAIRAIEQFEQENIVFQEVELAPPSEWTQPLTISVKINDYLLLGVLIDTGASRSLVSLSSLGYLDIDESEVDRTPFMCIGFD